MKIRKLAVAAVLNMGLAIGAVAEEVKQEKNPVDPWEGVNRGVFAFNDALDGVVLKPIAKGYKAVTPDVVETGVSNVFSNLGEVGNIVHGLLQFKIGQASNDTGRLLINSILGLAGIFDVAKNMGLEKGTGEDLGQTLATWGVDSGPYVVLPFLGPTTIRDSVGLPADSYLNPVTYIDHVPTRNTMFGTDLVDTRASLLGAEGAISGDKYTFIRDAYLQRREYLISNGQLEDDFGSDLDEEDF